MRWAYSVVVPLLVLVVVALLLLVFVVGVRTKVEVMIHDKTGKKTIILCVCFFSVAVVPSMAWFSHHWCFAVAMLLWC